MSRASRGESVRTERHVRGFTLIEVVVALAILSLCLSVLYQTFGQSLRRAFEIRQRELAFMTAQSMLEGIASRRVFKPEHRTGVTAEGLSWELLIEPWGSESYGDAVVRPVLVEVQVKGAGRSSAHLRAIELGEIQAP
jgi:prepilin-type N-terminal cleavage/methylation domain-containing protein